MSKRKTAVSTLTSNAEVTDQGIRSKDGDKLVVGTTTPYGSFKKQLVAAVIIIQSVTIFVGLADGWVDWYVHVAYPLGSLTVLGLVTLAFAKVR
jgi:hypothetical protein